MDFTFNLNLDCTILELASLVFDIPHKWNISPLISIFPNTLM